MATIVSAENVRANLQITGDADAFVDVLIEAAEKEIESRCNLQIFTTTITDYLDGGGESLFLSKSPVSAVATLTDTSSGTVWNAVNYEVYLSKGIITSTIGDFTAGAQRWEVIYQAGFGAAQNDVPADLRLAAMRMISFWYDNPIGFKSESLAGHSYQVGTADIPDDIGVILNRYRRRSV